MDVPSDRQGWVSSVASVFGATARLLAVLAVSLALVESAVGAARWGWPGFGIWLESFVWAISMLFGGGLLLLALPALGLGLVSTRSTLTSIANTVCGPSSGRWWMGLVWTGAALVVAIPIRLALMQLDIQFFMYKYSGRTSAALIALTLMVIVYRLVSVRVPKLASSRWSLLFSLLFVGYLLTVRNGQFLVPYRLVIPLVPILLVGIWVLAEFNVHRFRFTKHLAIGLLASVFVWLWIYPSRHSAHSFLMERTLLIFPALQTLWFASDIDGDNFSSLPMGGDCAPFDIAIAPDAFEIVKNGVDENCNDVVLQAVDVALPAENARMSRASNRNVILVMFDTLRADYAPPLRADLTPNLRAFTEDAIVLERAYAPSNHTDEVVPSTLTSNYPVHWAQNGLFYGLDPNLPEVLGAFGYWALAVSCLPWARDVSVSGYTILDNSCGRAYPANDRDADLVQAKRAVSWLGKRPNQPMFMWLHFLGPHLPNWARPELDQLAKGDEYAADVIVSDVAFGEFIKGLKAAGIYDDSIIVVYSDHGEGLTDHWSRTHARTAYEEVVRVPFYIKLPSQQAQAISTPVSTGQIFATVTDALGIEGLERRAMPSLMPLIKNEVDEQGPLYVEGNFQNVQTVRAVVDGPWKLVFDNRKRHYLLFNVEEDPDERMNLLHVEQERFANMRKHLWTWWDEQANDVLLKKRSLFWDGQGFRAPKMIIGDTVIDRSTPKSDLGAD